MCLGKGSPATLRAADEHKTLELSQFTVDSDENVHYAGKNYQGRRHQRKVDQTLLNLEIYAECSIIYSEQVLGIHTLENIVKPLCSEERVIIQIPQSL